MTSIETDFTGEGEVVENPTLKAAYNLAPLHHNQPLRWNYEVQLVGEKIYDKVIHLCELCELPILIYGRMLPCKHIFCFDCARKCVKTCKRCSNKVLKVEKSALGTVYVCTHGAPKHSTKGCRRTYLSQRDLQSHIAHRHLPKSSGNTSSVSNSTSTNAGGGDKSSHSQVQLPLTQQQAAQQAALTSQTSSTSQHGHVSVQQRTSPPAVTVYPSISQVSAPTQSVIPGLGDLHQVSAGLQTQETQPQAAKQPSYRPQIPVDHFRPPNQTTMNQANVAFKHQSNPVFSPNQISQSPNQINQPIQTNSPRLPIASTDPASGLSVATRSNNLITVPIQDEGQYRPLPFVPNSQTGMPGFPPPSASAPYPVYASSVSQAGQNFSTQRDPQKFNPIVNREPQNFSSQREPQPYGISSQRDPQSFSTNSQSAMFQAKNPNQFPNTGRSQGQQGMRPGMHQQQQRAPRAPLTTGFVPDYRQQVNRPRAPPGQPMPRGQSVQTIPIGQGGQIIQSSQPRPVMSMNPQTGQRFPAGGHWSSQNPRGAQPRMNQGQPRPRGEQQYQQNYYN